jgi:hypothetical protein
MNIKSTLLILSCMFIANCSFTGTAMVERQFDKQKMDDYLSSLSENNKAILSIEIVEKGKQLTKIKRGLPITIPQGKK